MIFGRPTLNTLFAVLLQYTVTTYSLADDKEAYATMLYNDGEGFILGVRVLGLSIKNSGTNRDMVVLCAEGVSEDTKDTLKNDGWIVKSVNSHDHKPSFMTKLEIWRLTEYRRVVYLDADAIVTQNIDELFRCGAFCAVFRAFDLFNAGVLVLKPSLETYNKLINKIDPHASGDDQHLLNVYYRSLCYARMFNASDHIYHDEPLRLHSGYNPDTSIYYFWSGWKLINEKQVKIIHYTLGPVKPWKWWAYSIFDLNWRWIALKESLDHPGEEYHELQVWFLLPLGIILLMMSVIYCLYYSCRVVKYHIIERKALLRKMMSLLGQAAAKDKYFFFSVMFVLSHYYAFLCVPTTMPPHQAVILMAVWVLFFQGVFHATYINLCIGYTGCHSKHRVSERLDAQPTNNSLYLKIEGIFWFVLSVVFCVSLFYVPFAFSEFSRRLRYFLMMTFLYLAFSYFVSRRMIHLCLHNTQKTYSRNVIM